ncbi:MAG TPA: peroxiredoxin [Polyangiaceae bacterium]|nr:peroxiredoxin [Polyangiaceae bacterium]
MTLAVGEKAPGFTLPSASGPVSLDSLVGARALVLFFYPKDESPGCTREACSFRDQYDAFVEAGADVVGISPDSLESHAHFSAKHALRVKLLSDTGGKVAALYGVSKTLGLFPGRATFVIDRQGVVRHVFVSQVQFWRHTSEALDAIRKLSAPAR